MIRFVVLGICLAPLMAGAQVFKCVDGAGHTTFSQSPCPQAVSSEAIEVRQANSLPAISAPERVPRSGGLVSGIRDTREEEQAALERAIAEQKALRREQRKHSASMPAPAQPSGITSCDPGGCWDNLGGRYNKGGGSTYFPAAGGPACQMIGGQMICP